MKRLFTVFTLVSVLVAGVCGVVLMAPTSADAHAVAGYNGYCQFADPFYVSSINGSGVSGYLMVYGSTLFRGQVCQIGKSQLAMQTDGNLVLYDENGHARWAASWTRPDVMGNGHHAVIQSDNNFVLYDRNTVPRWASDTWRGVPGGLLAVQDDGNLVVYNNDLIPLWATNTYH